MVSWSMKSRLELPSHLCARVRDRILENEESAPAKVIVFAMGCKLNQDIYELDDYGHRHRRILPRPR
jgi:hypothetical protein